MNKYKVGETVGPHGITLVEELGSIFAKPSSKRKERFGMWTCPKCGSIFRASVSNVSVGATKGCGCTRVYKPGSIIGDNKLTLVKDLGSSNSARGNMGLFICPNCSKEFKTIISKVRTGVTKGCGCTRGGLKQYVVGTILGDYGIKIVTDLGLIYPTSTSTTKQHMGLFNCSACNEDFKTRFTDVSSNTVKSCPSCSRVRSGIKNQDLLVIGQPIGPDNLILLADLGMQYTTDGSKRKVRYGMFTCPDCTKPFKNIISAVRNDGVRSCTPCGYLRAAESRSEHGLTGSKIYKMYRSMIERCYYKEYASYKDYGARGITICEEWLADVTVFHTWALSNIFDESLLGYGNGKLSIDRKDVNGNYEPGNCRFVTSTVQNLNKQISDRKVNSPRLSTRYHPVLDSLVSIPYSDANDKLLSELLTNLLTGVPYAPVVDRLSTTGIINLDLTRIVRDLQDCMNEEEYLQLKVIRCLKDGTIIEVRT